MTRSDIAPVCGKSSPGRRFRAKERRHAIGFIFTIHATLTKQSWLDQGLFLQNLMLAAHVRVLATCPQVSFVRFQPIIAEQFGLGSDELVTCGMSLGYADEEAAVDRLNTPREPVQGFTRWLGFEEQIISVSELLRYSVHSQDDPL